jgi:hypothetical protein
MNDVFSGKVMYHFDERKKSYEFLTTKCPMSKIKSAVSLPEKGVDADVVVDIGFLFSWEVPLLFEAASDALAVFFMAELVGGIW